ncbi:hypothetical protein [Paenibacillus massiliensis]|uniref:hypothetical protein n=1 Tax=Paenibacillus massiliensis TaxID=225917 RepID=UPI0004B0EBF7|nr:hypothetical protein [Paenibacillus massiliensis]
MQPRRFFRGIQRQTKGRPRKLRPRLRKFISVLLAALLPGVGHLSLGLYMRGLTFLMLLLLDISAMLYVSSVGLQINVPLLILLGIFIPVLYFYNVYDVLQSADYITLYRRKPRRLSARSTADQPQSRFDAWEQGTTFALLLILGGGLMVLFHTKPRWLGEFFAAYGFVLTALLLVGVGLLLFIREVGISVKRQRDLREKGE